MILISSGLVKKLLIADNIGAYVNWNIDFGIGNMSTLEAWAFFRLDFSLACELVAKMFKILANYYLKDDAIIIFSNNFVITRDYKINGITMHSELEKFILNEEFKSIKTSLDSSKLRFFYKKYSFW